MVQQFLEQNTLHVYKKTNNGPYVNWIDYLPSKQEVVGSNPAGPAKKEVDKPTEQLYNVSLVNKMCTTYF